MFSICSNIMVLTKNLVTLLELRERGCPSSQVTGITVIQSKVPKYATPPVGLGRPPSFICGTCRGVLFVKQERECGISRIGAQTRTQSPPQGPPGQFEFPISNALELRQRLLG